VERGEPSGSFDISSIGPQGKEEHKMPVGLMFIHCPLKHSLKDFVNNFNLDISLGVVRG